MAIQTAIAPQVAQTAAMPQQMERKATPAPLIARQGPKTTTIALVAAAILVPLALFGIGFLRTRIESAARRLAERSEEIDVPLGLPIIIAEIAREAR